MTSKAVDLFSDLKYTNDGLAPSDKFAAIAQQILPSSDFLGGSFKTELSKLSPGVEFVKAKSPRRNLVLASDRNGFGFRRRYIYGSVDISCPDIEAIEHGSHSDVSGALAAYEHESGKAIREMAQLVAERISCFREVNQLDNQAVTFRFLNQPITWLQKRGVDGIMIRPSENRDCYIAILGGYFFLTPMGEEYVPQ